MATQPRAARPPIADPLKKCKPVLIMYAVNSGDVMRVRSFLALPMTIVLLLAGLVCAVPARAAAAPKMPAKTSRATGFTISSGGATTQALKLRSSSSNSAAALANPCGGFVVVTRFSQCVFVPAAQIDFFIAGVPVGNVTVQMTRQIGLNVRSNSFHEDITLEVLDVVGEAVGTTLTTFTATCGGSCTATSELPEDVVLRTGEVLKGTVDYTDSTQTRHTTRTIYELTFFNVIPVEPILLSSAEYRCDNEVGILPGCVFPDAIPTLTDMRQLPAISSNISAIQAAGPHHYGSEILSEGKNPLHRTTNASIRRANRRAACTGRSNPFPVLLSCDEYPFASTLEGASRTSPPDWGYAFVPVLEQGLQAAILSNFVQDQRVLDGDAYWVQV